MAWIWRYRAQLYLRNSVWIPPVLGMIAGIMTARILHSLRDVLGWQSDMAPETARTLMITLASAMLTFVVFVSSAMLLALQLASAQLTPRIIAFVFRDPITKLSLMLFVFTFTFLSAAAAQIDQSISVLTHRLVTYSCMASLAVFFYLIDHVGRLLRPNEILRSVARQGRRVIESVYPHALVEPPAISPAFQKPMSEKPSTTVIAAADGVLLACDVGGVVALAEQADCVIELVPQVGHFVAAGDPLFRIFGGRMQWPASRLARMVAIGHERTLEQDPAFAFRIIVDVASKALSPAINDPTTAVLAVDQIHHLLRTVGQRRLDDERVRDAKGRLRVIYRTPGWEDFVRLAVTEIRQFGGESMQIARRLRAMLENLIQTLPEDRGKLLRRELNLLNRTAARFFPEPEDQALAAVSDSLGLGGRTDGATATREAAVHGS